MYEKYDWLCGSDIKNSLFCFPCLLFALEKAESCWVKTGIVDLAHLAQKAKKQERSQVRINSQFELKLLGKNDIRQQLDSGYRRQLEQQNDIVLKNRCALKNH